MVGSAPPAAGAQRADRAPRAEDPLRTLGLPELVASGVAFIAPAFSLAAVFVFLALTGGRYAPEGVALGTLAALLAASSFIAMSRRHPKAGGAYAFVGAEFPSPVAFVAGWGLSLLYLVGPAIPLFLVVEGVIAFDPALAGWALPLVLAVVAVVFTVNAVGLRPSTRLALLVFLVEAGVLLAIAVALFLHPPVAPPAAAAAPSGILLALGGSGALAVFLFLGFDAVSTYAEEAHVPRRDIGRGTLIAILVAGVVYVTSAFAYLRAISWTDPTATLPGSVGFALGAWGAEAMGLVIIVSSFGALIAVENACARVFFAMGRDGLLPRSVARLYGPARVPWVPLALSAGTTGVLAAGAIVPFLSFPSDFMTVLLPALVVVGALMAYILVALSWARSLWRERAGNPRWLAALLLALGSAGLSVSLLVIQPYSWGPAAGPIAEIAALWFVVGAGLWWAGRSMRERVAEPATEVAGA